MRRVMAISGGVGGAKLSLGLAAELDPAELLIVVNTGDDFDYLGLRICPDLDTVMYTLSGCADPERGWGLAGETWHCLDALNALGAPDWFRLGDRDLATHLRRSEWLRAGATLSAVTTRLATALGVRHGIAPMSDDDVRTVVRTAQGDLAFQVYFVRERCVPRVNAVRFEGAERAAPSPVVRDWLYGEERGLVVMCPSNPFLSIDPVLCVPGVREGLRRHRVTAIAPIVGGRALKGPAAKMMAELGMQVSAEAVALHYRGVVDMLVIDNEDAAQADAIRASGMQVMVTNTVMRTLDDKRQLAREVLACAERWLS